MPNRYEEPPPIHKPTSAYTLKHAYKIMNNMIGLTHKHTKTRNVIWTINNMVASHTSLLKSKKAIIANKYIWKSYLTISTTIM